MELKRGAKLFVSVNGGPFTGPLKWTLVREWAALGFIPKSAMVKFTPDSTPITADQILALWQWSQQLRDTAAYYHSSGRNTGPSCPRQHQYLRHLGCPIDTAGFDKHLCYRLVGDLEQAFPDRAIPGETSRIDEDLDAQWQHRPATAKQITYLRTQGIDGRKMTVTAASRAISGPATPAQLRKLADLGGGMDLGDITKEDAAALIDRTIALNQAEEQTPHVSDEMKARAAEALAKLEAEEHAAKSKPWWKFW